MLPTPSRQGWRRHHLSSSPDKLEFLRDFHNGKRKGQKNTNEWLFSECLLGVVLVDNHDANSAGGGGGEDNGDEEEAFDTYNYDFSSMPLSSIAATRTIVLERITNKYQKRQPTTRLAPHNQNEILLLLLLLHKKHISQTDNMSSSKIADTVSSGAPVARAPTKSSSILQQDNSQWTGEN
jgi:hypothetical protein